MQLNKEKEDEITKLEAHWRNKLNAAEKQNIELEKSMAKQFQAGVSQVETLLPYVS